MAAFLFVAAQRIGYPYELEWLEGVSVDHLERLVAGEPLYVAPSLDWVPFSYPPLYYLCAWPLALLTGVSFTPLRAVSALASLASMALAGWLVWAETGCAPASLATAGLYAATFRIGGAWFDVARVDALFVALLLAAIALVRRGRGFASAVVAGLALFGAVWTKQTALALIPALVLAGLDRPWRAILTGSLAGAASLAAATWLHRESNGWFTYYAFLLPRKHYEYGCAQDFWWRDVWLPMSVPCVLTGLALAGLALARSWAAAAYGVVFAALVGASWVSRIHCGGYDNVLMPAYAALTLGTGLALGLARRLEERRGGWLAIVLVWVAFAYQLADLRYDARAQIPTLRDRAAAADLTFRVSQMEGSVWVFQHNRIAALAGKPRLVHWMALCDVLRDPDPGPRDRLREELKFALEYRRFGAIVTDDLYFPVRLPDHYERIGPLFEVGDVLWPVTGMRCRPTWVWRPKPR